MLADTSTSAFVCGLVCACVRLERASEQASVPVRVDPVILSCQDSASAVLEDGGGGDENKSGREGAGRFAGVVVGLRGRVTQQQTPRENKSEREHGK